MSPDQSVLRTLPKVDSILKMAEAETLCAPLPRPLVAEAIRWALDSARGKILAGEAQAAPTAEEILALARSRAETRMRPSLRPVINATGVVLHTNLGRSILGAAAAEGLFALASSYSTLEYDPQTGTRGSRHQHVEDLLKNLIGCQGAMVVNNNAASMLLIMAALFKGREVVVSAGEMVEIGGSFRIPEIMEQGGAVLKAVGTTNKTRLSDYEKAVGGQTGGLLKVHTSNFRVIGYTQAVTVEELAPLARRENLPLICDLGSGTLVDLSPLGIRDEPTVGQMLEAGADLVCFSGDKLLGGPQAGLIVGRRDLVAELKAHPLARAMRVDKLTLAALEPTLRLYLEPEKAVEAVPTLAMLFAKADDLRPRAEKLLERLKDAGDLKLEIAAVESQAGGGAAPERPIKSWAVAVESPAATAAALEEKLRHHEVPVVARVYHDRLLLDVRTITDAQFFEIARAFRCALSAPAQ